jgi:hypothetical protein
MTLKLVVMSNMLKIQTQKAKENLETRDVMD